MKLLHSNVLIQLEALPSEYTTESGIFMGSTTVRETDAGNVKTVVNEEDQYSRIGTVLEVADKPTQDYPDVVKGVKIKMGRGFNAFQFQFVLNPDDAWTGQVLVPSGLIELIL